MKARTPLNKREAERVAQDTFDTFVAVINDTVAEYVCMTCRYFGLGPKRANAFIDFCTETSKEFTQYIQDGILTDKLKEELISRGIDPNCIYSPDDDIKQMAHTDKKRQERNKPSESEATQMIKARNAFHRLMKEDKE